MKSILELSQSHRKNLNNKPDIRIQQSYAALEPYVSDLRLIGFHNQRIMPLLGVQHRMCVNWDNQSHKLHKLMSP